MPEISFHLDRLIRYARRLAAKTRLHHLAAALAVAAVAVGLAGIRTLALPGPRPVLDGERLRIQVVAPVEPEIIAGPVMEVGELVDVLESPPPTRAMAEPAAYAPADEEIEAWEAEAAPGRYAGEAVVHAPSQPRPADSPRREGRVARWFGFDGPERDYRAEREARRVRREAEMERQREGRERRWYRSDGQPVDDRDVDREWRARGDDGPPSDRRD